MILKYNININNAAINSTLKKIINKIYKLLPYREEGLDWKKPLETIIEELSGMDRLFVGHPDLLFPILCKLEGLFLLTESYHFGLYRRTIFECLNLLSEVRKLCQEE